MQALSVGILYSLKDTRQEIGSVLQDDRSLTVLNRLTPTNFYELQPLKWITTGSFHFFDLGDMPLCVPAHE